MDMDSRRAVGTLTQDLRSLVVEQWGIASQTERLGLSGCFCGGGRVQLELGLRVGVRLRRGYGSGRAGDMVKVGGGMGFNQPGQGIGAVWEWCTAMQTLILRITLDDGVGTGGIGVSGMDGMDEECEEE